MVGKQMDFYVQTAALVLSTTYRLERAYIVFPAPQDTSGQDLYFWAPEYLFVVLADLITPIQVHRGVRYSVRHPAATLETGTFVVVELTGAKKFRPWSVSTHDHFATMPRVPSSRASAIPMDSDDAQATEAETETKEDDNFEVGSEDESTADELVDIRGSRLRRLIHIEDRTLIVSSSNNQVLCQHIKVLDPEAVVDELRRSPETFTGQAEVTFSTTALMATFLSVDEMWRAGAKIGQPSRREFLETWASLQLHTFPRRALEEGGLSVVAL